MDFEKKGCFLSFYPPWILEKGGIVHKVCHAKALRFSLHGFSMGIIFRKQGHCFGGCYSEKFF